MTCIMTCITEQQRSRTSKCCKHPYQAVMRLLQVFLPPLLMGTMWSNVRLCLDPQYWQQNLSLCRAIVADDDDDDGHRSNVRLCLVPQYWQQNLCPCKGKNGSSDVSTSMTSSHTVRRTCKETETKMYGTLSLSAGLWRQ